MDAPYVLSEFDWQRQIDHSGPFSSAPRVTRIGDGVSWNTVVWSDLNQQNADETIDREISFFRERRASFEWKLFSHDSPPDLRHRLTAKGFTIGELEALLVLDLTCPPEWCDSPPSHRVVKASTLEHLAIYKDIAERVFEQDYTYTYQDLAKHINEGSTQHIGFIGYAGEIPVSVGRLYTMPGNPFSGLYGGGTLKNYRRQGIYRAVTAARAHVAAQLGAKYLQVDALPTSRPILERLGFCHLADTWPCVMTFD